nr:chromatin assembly factor 1 subunit FSM-like [Lolium perenne]
MGLRSYSIAVAISELAHVALVAPLVLLGGDNRRGISSAGSCRGLLPVRGWAEECATDPAQLKRKRASNGPAIATAEKEALVAGCRQELQGLFEYYKEVSGHRMQLEGGNLSSNAMIGCLLEESNLGLTKLVDEAFEKLKETEGVSVASVRSSVLLIGQRMMYGQSSPDADVLEDESELSLWCWEVRDLKLMPVKIRGFLSGRRTARKKIHERINAIRLSLSVLKSPGAEAQVNRLRKVSIKLSKALNLEGIRSMVERLTQKNNIPRCVPLALCFLY